MSHRDISLGHDAPQTAASGHSPAKHGSLELSQTTWQQAANKNHLCVDAVFLRFLCLHLYYCAAFWTYHVSHENLVAALFIYLAEYNLKAKTL